MDGNKKDNRRFSKGVRGSGVYTCRLCGKKTRETGDHESEALLCRKCNEYTLNENSHNDCHSPENPGYHCIFCEQEHERKPSARKPHNDNAGYVTELKDKVEGGHIVIYDRNKGFEIDADYRWIVMHEPSSIHISVPSLRLARLVMKDASTLGYDAVLG